MMKDKEVQVWVDGRWLSLMVHTDLEGEQLLKAVGWGVAWSINKGKVPSTDFLEFVDEVGR